jgi:uncharacterized damage-inducible protein DinB
MTVSDQMSRPDATEYADYYGTYIDQVPDGPVLEVLAGAPDALEAVLADVAPSVEMLAYAEGKWSVREVLGHVLDTERVFSYRALHMARLDPAELPGMDQDLWTPESFAAGRPVADQLVEFRALRAANVALFRSFSRDVLDRTGVASGVVFSVRALVFIVAGHEIHHRRVLAERYVTALRGGAGV